MLQFKQVRIKICNYKKVKEIAERDNRSIANLINKILDDYLKQQGN